MNKRGLTIGTKVRINCPSVNSGAFHGKTGKVIRHIENEKFPYLVEINIKGHYPDIPFNRSELVRVNRKRKT
jgi:ribosomal protein L21E